MRTLTIVVAVAALSLAACKKKDKEAPKVTPPVAAVDAAAAGSAVGSAEPTAVDPAMANKAGNCPVAVVGAVGTVVEDKAHPEVVVLAIVAKEPAAVETIRRRASHLVEVQSAPDAEIKHSGEGTGGGEGPCPVVTSKEVTIASESIDGGVKVTMTPSGALTAADLAKDVAARLAKMASLKDFKATDHSGGGGGVGGGSGDHGGNHSGDADGKGKEEKKLPPGEKPVTPGSGAGSES